MVRLHVLAVAESAAGAEVLGAGLARCNHLRVLALIEADSGVLAGYPGERPDVAVVEVAAEDAGGLARVGELAALAIPVVAVLSDVDRAGDAWDAGARGVVRMGAADGWQPVIEVVAGGGVGLAEDIVAAIYFKVTEVEAPSPSLTAREIEVLRMVADGHANAKIARALDITLAGVDYHLRMIYEKLGVRNRAAAVSVAMELGAMKRRQWLRGSGYASQDYANS